MDNKLLSVIVAATVSIILVAGLLIPVIADANEGQKITYVNNGYRAENAESDVSYTWDSVNGITIGTEKIPASGTANGPMAILFADTGFIKTNFAGNSALFIDISNGSIGAGNNITSMSVSVDVDTKTISITDIVAASTIADFSFTYSEWAYIPSIDGDMVLYAPYSDAKSFHVTDEANIKGFFYYGNSWAFSLDGSEVISSKSLPTYELIEDRTADQRYTGVSSISISSSTDTNYNIKVSDSPYYAGIVAIERSATGITETGNSMAPLLAVIPLLVIIAILVMVVFVVFRRD